MGLHFSARRAEHSKSLYHSTEQIECQKLPCDWLNICTANSKQLAQQADQGLPLFQKNSRSSASLKKLLMREIFMPCPYTKAHYFIAVSISPGRGAVVSSTVQSFCCVNLCSDISLTKFLTSVPHFLLQRPAQ